MFYLILFTIIAGAIASLAFYFLYKRHINKNGLIKEKSFIMIAPKIFGSINTLLALFFGIWYVIDPTAFSQGETIDNKIVFVLVSILYIYFYIFALPLNIGSITLTTLLKKRINSGRYIYDIATNTLAAMLLFIFLSYLVLSK